MKRIRVPLQIIGRCQLAVCLENENENCTNDEAKNIVEFAIFAPPNEIRSWSTIQYTAALSHGISFLQAFCSLLIVRARALAGVRKYLCGLLICLMKVARLITCACNYGLAFHCPSYR